MSTQTAAPKAKGQKEEVIALLLKPAKDGEISKALGISDEREGEICQQILENAWDDKHTLQQRMQSVAKITKNHNELAWAMFVFGCHVSEGQETPVGSLAVALGFN